MKSAVAGCADQIIEWTKAIVRFASENRPPDGTEADLQAFQQRIDQARRPMRNQ